METSQTLEVHLGSGTWTNITILYSVNEDFLVRERDFFVLFP